jgi:hypothetical protein
MNRDELLELMARGIARRNYPSATDADIEEMWEGFLPDAQAALASIEAAGCMVVPGWRDIASAPRDGTDILVLWGDGTGACLVVSWDEGASDPKWPWLTLDGPNYHLTAFSHWMPLPASPLQNGEG